MLGRAATLIACTLLLTCLLALSCLDFIVPRFSLPLSMLLWLLLSTSSYVIQALRPIHSPTDGVGSVLFTTLAVYTMLPLSHLGAVVMGALTSLPHVILSAAFANHDDPISDLLTVRMINTMNIQNMRAFVVVFFSP